MTKDEAIGFGLMAMIVIGLVWVVAVAIENKPIRRDGLCVNGLVYSVDSGMNPTFNRLDADGKPMRCTEKAP